MRLIGVLLLAALPSVAAGQVDTVRAELGKQTAWAGEPVPLIVTLYSPGPFSGTASFDLPEIPQTAILRSEIPVVGSEELDGESYFTQRHELTFYTQRTGTVVIPPIRVRFEGKKDFVSDPEPMQGRTDEIQFESKRPPGTEAMGVVVSMTELEVADTWEPQPEHQFQAGDVIIRTVKRTARGTTAMMLPPVSNEAPQGVRVYTGQAEVRDNTDRGNTKAVRTDVLKYQLEQAGTFTLPKLTFVFWNLDTEELETKDLPAQEVTVTDDRVVATESTPPLKARSPRWGLLIGLLIGLAVVTALSISPLRRLYATWQTWHNRPEAVAVRTLKNACRSHDAASAYQAFLSWSRSIRPATEDDWLAALLAQGAHRQLNEQWIALSRQLFAGADRLDTWDGAAFWSAFCQSRASLKKTAAARTVPDLPALNPPAPLVHS